MPTSLNIKKASRAVCIEIAQLTKGAEWMVWSYCGIYKNQKAKSQPLAYVAFKVIIGGCLSVNVRMHTVPLTSLGQLTIGSIWKDGICESSLEFVTQNFDIDFRIDGWRYTSFEQSAKDNVAPPYPQAIHPLQFQSDKNWLIEFKLSSGGKLVVPCLEFFSRCYGRSQEINRILATFPWSGLSDSCESKLYAPLDEPEEPNKWKVKLRKRLRNGDTTLLAHAKYDRYTREAAKSIYSQIEKSYVPGSKSPLFIQIGPWFQGPAEIKAKGIWFDNNRSFLALQIMGGSDPDGILIIRYRENSSLGEGDQQDNASDGTWNGAPNKGLIRPPDIVDLTGDEEPDHGASNVEILDQDYVVMGIPRAIVDRHGKKVAHKSRARGKGDEVSTYSSGEPHGSGKGVGFASIHAKPVMESHGALMDMWNAVQHVQKKYPGRIQNVDWFTFEDGYQSIGRPNLIALDPIEEDNDTIIPTTTKNWIYYDVATVRIRGVMVVRLLINGIPIHIVELQRRPIKIKGENNQEKDGEQSFKGFVIIIENYDQFARWLKRFLSDVRYVRGIVQKLTQYAPGKADAFSHKSASYEKVPGEAAVIKALEKMGVVL